MVSSDFPPFTAHQSTVYYWASVQYDLHHLDLHLRRSRFRTYPHPHLAHRRSHKTTRIFLAENNLFPLENDSRLERRLSPLILSGITTLPIQFSRRAWSSPMRSARAGRGTRIFSPEDPLPRSLLHPHSSSSIATFLVFHPRPPALCCFETHATPVLLPAYPPLRFIPHPKLQAAHRLASHATYPNPHPPRRTPNLSFSNRNK